MNGQQVRAWDLEPTPANASLLQQVVRDLETVHNPRTNNQQRLQAQTVSSLAPETRINLQRLDQVRDNPASWRLAIALASQQYSLPDPVRHYGISILESETKYFWGTYNDAESLAIRHGLLELCGQVCRFAHTILNAS